MFPWLYRLHTWMQRTTHRCCCLIIYSITEIVHQKSCDAISKVRNVGGLFDIIYPSRIWSGWTIFNITDCVNLPDRFANLMILSTTTAPPLRNLNADKSVAHQDRQCEPDDAVGPSRPVLRVEARPRHAAVDMSKQEARLHVRFRFFFSYPTVKLRIGADLRQQHCTAQ